MWLDDEGMINEAGPNLGATRLYALHRQPHQLYYGHALFTGGADAEGNTLGLTSDEAAHLVEMHLTAGHTHPAHRQPASPHHPGRRRGSAAPETPKQPTSKGTPTWQTMTTPRNRPKQTACSSSTR